MSDYRVKVQVKNNRLLSRIEEVGYKTIAAFCRDYDINQQEAGRIINLQRSPLNSDGDYNPTAIKIIDALMVCPSEIWSDEQLTLKLESNTSSISLSSDEMRTLSLSDNSDMELDIAKVLTHENLKPRLAKAIKMRFGLDGYAEHTIKDVGKELGVSAGRAQQIIAHGLSKLRHKKVSEGLRAYVGGEQ